MGLLKVRALRVRLFSGQGCRQYIKALTAVRAVSVFLYADSEEKNITFS
jgi:hypothetical protein